MFHPTSRMLGVATTVRRVGWLYVVQGLALGAWAVAETADKQPAADDGLLAASIVAGGVIGMAAAWRLNRGDLWAYGVAVPLVGLLFAGECVLVVTHLPLFLAVPVLGRRAGLLLIILPGVGFFNAVYAVSDIRDAYRARRRERLYDGRGFEPVLPPGATPTPSPFTPARVPPRPGAVRSRPRP